jgi:DDE_Tnp_1-associated
MSSVLLTLFSELADRHRDQGKMYPLAPILLFTVLGMLAGARSYRQAHAFIRTHLDRLNRGFGLSLRRAPAYSSVRFILRGLDAAAIKRAFRAHAAGLADVPAEGAGAGDGRAIRGGAAESGGVERLGAAPDPAKGRAFGIHLPKIEVQGLSPWRVWAEPNLAYYFRRSRFTFARVRLTNGANTAALPRPRMSAAVENCIAATFSATMRRYSAGVHVPCAIIRARRKIVSQDAAASRAIIIIGKA